MIYLIGYFVMGLVAVVIDSFIKYGMFNAPDDVIEVMPLVCFWPFYFVAWAIIAFFKGIAILIYIFFDCQ